MPLSSWYLRHRPSNGKVCQLFRLIVTVGTVFPYPNSNSGRPEPRGFSVNISLFVRWSQTTRAVDVPHIYSGERAVGEFSVLLFSGATLGWVYLIMSQQKWRCTQSLLLWIWQQYIHLGSDKHLVLPFQQHNRLIWILSPAACACPQNTNL